MENEDTGIKKEDFFHLRGHPIKRGLLLLAAAAILPIVSWFVLLLTLWQPHHHHALLFFIIIAPIGCVALVLLDWANQAFHRKRD